MKIINQLTFLFVVITLVGLVGGHAPCEAMVDAPGSSHAVKNSIHDGLGAQQESAGYFGGVKSGRFLLVLSEGVRRYFGVTGETRVYMSGKQISIEQLPLNSHIRVITKKAVVMEVHVLEGQ